MVVDFGLTQISEKRESESEREERIVFQITASSSGNKTWFQFHNLNRT